MEKNSRCYLYWYLTTLDALKLILFVLELFNLRWHYPFVGTWNQCSSVQFANIFRFIFIWRQWRTNMAIKFSTANSFVKLLYLMAWIFWFTWTKTIHTSIIILQFRKDFATIQRLKDFCLTKQDKLQWGNVGTSIQFFSKMIFDI